MPVNLKNRSVLEMSDFSREELRFLLDLSRDLKRAKYAGVPVYNGLTDESHPTQMLADLLTMEEHSESPLHRVAYCYLGDARNNMGNSLLLVGARMGMDVRLAAPKALWPADPVVARA